MRAGSAVAFWSVVAVLCVGAVVHVVYYFPRTVDDMFIFLRYADNIGAGFGPVYNVGERVEGYSSSVWLGLLALGEVLGPGGVSWAKLLGCVSLLWLLWGLFVLGRERFALDRWEALIAPAFTIANSYVISWSLWGLETPAYLALLVWSWVTLGRYVDAPSSSRWASFAGIGSACALVRPEAPLLLACVGLGLWLEREGSVRRAAPIFAKATLPVVAVFGAYLLWRHAYYGLWLPHTYYAKSIHGFRLDQLAPLFGQGAGWFGMALTIGALGIAIMLSVRQKRHVPIVVMVGLCVFVVSVVIDWMPNQRHFLPFWLLIPLLWAAALQRLRVSSSIARPVRAVSLALMAVLLVGSAAGLVRTDSRYSAMDFRTHGRGKQWVLPKSRDKWHDTLQCFRRVTPEHVERMHPYHMGMITQLYRLIETDQHPLDESWYVGRDIGRVGYLAPVKVFDADGLFTPAVVADEAWRQDRSVSDALIHTAMNRYVVATELFGAWGPMVARSPDLRVKYVPLDRSWVHVKRRDGVPPDHATVVARYRNALAKMPQRYFLMTLYGEAVGAALQRRFDIVSGMAEPAGSE